MNSKLEIENKYWKLINENKGIIKCSNEKIIIDNPTSEKIEVLFSKELFLQEKNSNKIKVKFYGQYKNSGAYLVVNDCMNIPFNSTSIIDLNGTKKISLKIIVSAESLIEFKRVEIESVKSSDTLVDKVGKSEDVLVITPDYPSLENLYYCAFVHSRNREYIKNGLKVQVASISNARNNIETTYETNDIPVFRGSYYNLKQLLSRHQYKVIITHFVDENLYPIFDGYINNEKLIFICHGPETVFRYLRNVTRPYFTRPLDHYEQNDIFDLKEKYVKKYSNKPNVEWVFVSNWLKEFSEKELGIKFTNSRVINNIINEDLFPYSPKNEDDRKKILIIRKFDNIIQHSIDQIVLAILELSRRDFFNDLIFEVYGDGNYYDELIEPIRNFENVHLHRTFIHNDEISKIHAQNGIMLLPSRHDAHAVAMGEAASSGLVVVGSRVTSNPQFMNEKENHTLSDPENYIELADIVERLYRNPKEFLEISKRLSEDTRKNCSKGNTVMKEVSLIKECLDRVNTIETKYEKNDNPILTIAIPAYNVEKYISKCIDSIIKARNINQIEILVINDGSTDNTKNIVEQYEKKTNGIVRLINKENGGHGSTINTAILEATGKYFRLVDGDDWVDYENLDKLIDILKTCNIDVVLTKGSYEYVDTPELVDIIKYDNLVEGQIYHFEDLTYKKYGFETYGPLLTTGNYKTELLKKMDYKISEKKPYVDMEFNSFSLQYVDTLVYYNLDIYRYLIGREGQTISRDYWKKKYKDHIYIIFNILNIVYNSDKFSNSKKNYIYYNIIAQMVDSQIFMYDAMLLWKDIDGFLNKLSKYPEAYKSSLDYIYEKNGNCKLILETYKKVLSFGSYKRPIIIPGVRETVNDLWVAPLRRNLKWYLKCFVPYGALKLYRKIKSRFLEK